MSKSAIQIVRDLGIRIPDGFYANAAHTILYSHDFCEFTLPDRGGESETALYLHSQTRGSFALIVTTDEPSEIFLRVINLISGNNTIHPFKPFQTPTQTE